MNAIAAEIKQGHLGNCYMLVDAGCHDRYRTFPSAILPVELQKSRPDIMLLQGVHMPDGLSKLRAGRDQDPDLICHLVEVTFTSDPRVHEHMSDKQLQHAQLCRNLRAFGWVNVRLHVFIVGHSGVMRAVNAGILSQLGLDSGRVQDMLSSIALLGLQRSHGILRCFPFLRDVPDVASSGLGGGPGHDMGGPSPAPARSDAGQVRKRAASTTVQSMPADKRPRLSSARETAHRTSLFCSLPVAQPAYGELPARGCVHWYLLLQHPRYLAASACAP